MRKVALIFGGSGGIGQAICLLLEKKDITVYSTSFKKNKGKQTKHSFYCDITKIKDIKKVISSVLKRETTIDIVINSISPQLKLKTIEDLSTQEFKEDIDTILLGGVNIAKEIIPVMKTKENGLIINILSALVLGNVSTRMSSYVSAKYGLLGFTKCLALELLPFSISVLGISPSFVQTDLLKSFPDKLLEIEGNKRKSKELIQPIEVARVVLDLIQNPQKYKTGDNIEIN